MKESRRKRLDQLKGQLKQERMSFEPHWRELGDYILSQRIRLNNTQGNKGDRRNKNIIDITATLAARTLRSGMMSGVTSPARPWFRLSIADMELSESEPVKEWLHKVSTDMASVFIRSNLYNVLPTVYGDLGVFGTACMYLEEDENAVIRASAFPIGSYWLANDAQGRVQTFMRDFRLTVSNVVERFGKMGKDGKRDWSNISSYVKSQFEAGQTQTWVDVTHAIFPNDKHDPNMAESKHKRFASVYYESSRSSAESASSVDADQFLSEKGYDLFPILAPRWETTAEDVYGTSCPGMDALGDIKQLQLAEKRALQAIEKMVNPPMVGPTSLQNTKVSIVPGDITFSDEMQNTRGLRPIHDVNPRIQELEMKQNQVRQRISRAFYEDLFLMLANESRRQITATEIDERKEEKLLALGPVLEQLNQDLLDPLIDLTFEFMLRKGMIMEPPEELDGTPMRVDYISIMAQAQKFVGLGAIERFTGFAGQMAQLVPDVLKKIDTDQIIDIYAELTGIPPSIVRSDDKVAEMNQRIAQAQQEQQMNMQAQQGFQNAKQLSEINMDGNTALNQMMGVQ